MALAPVAAVSARELGRRVSLAGVAAVLAVLAAVGALADLHTGSRAPRAVLAVDRSASIDTAMRRVESRWIGRPRPTRFTGFSSEARILRSRMGSHPHRSPLREGAGVDIEWQL